MEVFAITGQHKTCSANAIRNSRKYSGGCFQLEAFFPDSRNVIKNNVESTNAATFMDVSNSYFNGLLISRSTKNGYLKSVRRYFYPTLGCVSIDEIKYSDFVELLASVEWSSYKIRNNSITPLRGVFEFSVADELIVKSPALDSQFARGQKPESDSVSVKEVELVLSRLNRNAEPAYNCFEFAVFTGLRSSELLALSWRDVDVVGKNILVRSTRVEGVLKGTKTYNSREVELNSRAFESLVRQKANSYLRGEEVFVSLSGEGYKTNKQLRLTWSSCLKSLGIRHRTSYQTRHTFATLYLMVLCGYLSRWGTQTRI